MIRRGRIDDVVLRLVGKYHVRGVNGLGSTTRLEAWIVSNATQPPPSAEPI